MIGKAKLAAVLVVMLFFISHLSAQEDLIGALFDPPTSQKEVRQLEEAARRGDSVSQYRLGMAFYYGGYLPQDGELSADWLLKAAKQGHPKAYLVLHQFSAQVSHETKKRIKDWLVYDQKKKAAMVGILPID